MIDRREMGEVCTVTPAPVAATSLTATAQPAAAISPTALTATLPAQPPGDATAASGRESLSSAGWGGGGGTLRVAGELLAGRRRVSTQIMGRLSGVRPGARVARGEGGALGALAAVKPLRVGAGWPRAVGRVWGGTRAAGRAVMARVAFVRDCLGALAASPPA